MPDRPPYLPPLTPGRARLLGELGRRLRWANTTPEQRREQMARVRAGQQRRYLERARALPGGDRLTDRQLAERAKQLRAADLAAWRLKAWTARQARKAAGR